MMRLLPLLLSLTLGNLCLAGPSVIDSIGREVVLEAPAQSIVGLAPHIVENLFSAGAGEKIVGVVSYADYPEQAGSIAQVGSAYAWSLETVVALNPDLVVLWGSGNGMSALPQLERMGLKVYVSEPRELADITASIIDFGILAGTQDIANASARKFEQDINALHSRFSSEQRLRVFYQIWNKPLQTINGEHMISHVLNLCAGDNIFATEQQLAPRISLESILEKDPDAIIASGMGESRPEWLDDWKQYGSLQAVQRGALFHVHPDLIQRPTTRIAQGATDLCDKLAGARNQLLRDAATAVSSPPH